VTHDELVERVAEAIYYAQGKRYAEWQFSGERVQPQWRNAARAASEDCGERP
jgi:hypothetical protein